MQNCNYKNIYLIHNLNYKKNYSYKFEIKKQISQLQKKIYYIITKRFLQLQNFNYEKDILHLQNVITNTIFYSYKL